MRNFAFLLSILCFSALFAQVREVEVAPGYSSTSVNTAVFRTNSLVTDGDTQYISFYDPEGYVVLGKRQIGSEHWTLNRTQYQGNVSDAHNIISIGIDGEGYIHASFDHHGHPLNYCKSVAPGSLELGDKEPMVGYDEGNVTYPEFYRLPSGDMLFAYRDGSSGRGNLVLNRYDCSNGTWHRVQDKLIDGEDQRNAYWQICVDGDGVIHVSWVWRETWLVETNHDMCYAYSPDGGKSWKRSDGTEYELPITASNAEYAWRIPQNSELINQTSMSTDAAGHPYIATYWRDEDSEVPQYRLLWHDGSVWCQRQVGNRIEPFSLSGGGTKMIPIARPRIAIDGNKAYYIIRDEERGSKVTMYEIPELKGEEVIAIDLTEYSVGAWEPTYDTELWKNQKVLNIFVQATRQGDGEVKIEGDATPVSVIEVKID